MDNSNSMLGLLGMESTSFLEELARSDDMPSGAQPVLANGSVMPSGEIGAVPVPGVAAASMELQVQQQQQQRQAAWGMGQMNQGAMHYDYAQYGMAKQQQQRMTQMAGYPGAMMQSNNAGPNHPNMSSVYGYPGMPMGAGQQQPHHNVTITPPRQAMTGNAMWNHSPSAVDPTASPSSYAAMAAQRAGIAQQQQHLGPTAQAQQQMPMGRTNGMQQQQPGSNPMYGQYLEYPGGAAPITQRVSAGYAETQQSADVAAQRGYCIPPQMSPLASPPAAASRLAQMSVMASGAGSSGPQMPRMPGAVGSASYQHQNYQPPGSGPAGNMDSSSFIGDMQGSGVHQPVGHLMSQGQPQYQYGHGGPVHSGQQGMTADGYGQFYAQPLYRMQGYPAVTQQSQMMSPNAQMSPQSRSGANRTQHLQSPQPTPRVTAAGPHSTTSANPGLTAAQFRTSMSRQPVPFVSNTGVPGQPMPSRMMMADPGKASGYSMGPSAQQAGSSSAMMMLNSASRYPGPNSPYQNLQVMTGNEMRQMYGMQQQQQPGLMEMQDRTHGGFPQQQAIHPQQSYYQQQQGQYQLQQQSQSMMMMMGSPGHMSQVQQQTGLQQQQQHPMQQQMSSPSLPQTGSSIMQGDTTINSMISPNNQVASVYGPGQISMSPSYIATKPQPTTASSAPTFSIPEVSGEPTDAPAFAPVLHLPDVRPPGAMSSSFSNSPPVALIPPSQLARDDEPLSTPPPLDVPDDAPRTFFPPHMSSTTSMSGGTTSAAQGAVPSFQPVQLSENCSIEMMSVASSDAAMPIVKEEKITKKKRKRKTEVVEGEEGLEMPKKSRKKKPKVAVECASSVEEAVLVPPPTNSGDVTEVEGNLSMEGMPMLSEGMPVVSEGTEAGILLPQPDPESTPRPKKSKAAKTPRDRKTPREGKTSRGDGKSSSRKRSSKPAKPLETSDDGTVLQEVVDSTTEMAENLPLEEATGSVGEATAGTEEQPEKIKPTPRPKSKKKKVPTATLR